MCGDRWSARTQCAKGPVSTLYLKIKLNMGVSSYSSSVTIGLTDPFLIHIYLVYGLSVTRGGPSHIDRHMWNGGMKKGQHKPLVQSPGIPNTICITSHWLAEYFPCWLCIWRQLREMGVYLTKVEHCGSFHNSLDQGPCLVFLFPLCFIFVLNYSMKKIIHEHHHFIFSDKYWWIWILLPLKLVLLVKSFSSKNKK